VALCTAGASPCNVQTANRLNNYAYTLGPAGNRTSVAELSGRTVGYGYDDIYRLTSETISGATSQTGNIGYTYDAVGNRTQLTSTVPIIPSSGLMNYNANDQLATDAYDANGNTIVNASTTNVYDFENHLVKHDAVTIAYDGDGNRVSETTGAGTTQYLVDTLNPTGYAQVVEELQNNLVTRRYTWGLELISQSQISNQQTTTSFYGFDGHGSVRLLTNSAGTITDTYDYDAFGNLLASTGSTSNNYLFAAEQFDPALGIYYNRARYYDERNGRFWTMDIFEGVDDTPLSLHRYAYVASDPVNNTDPCGMCLPSNSYYGGIVQERIFEDFLEKVGGYVDTPIAVILRKQLSVYQGGFLQPDLADPGITQTGIGQVYEIKSIYSEQLAIAKAALYAGVLNLFDPVRRWIPGVTYEPPSIIRVEPGTVAITSLAAPGVITYCLINELEIAALATLALAGLFSEIEVNFGAAALEEEYAF
jgi:RHS repeat-associated protein